jgi:hypothetical protein
MTKNAFFRFLRRHEDDLVAFAAVAFLLCHLTLQAIS